MKKNIAVFFLSILFFTTGYAQLDRSIRPEPGPAREIQLGDFESFTLKNGLQVIVVENRKVPVVSFSIRLNTGPIMEGTSKGYISLAGALMREGTNNRNKQQIDEEIDFIGASLSTSSGGMFGSSLKKHQDKLLDLMSDILLNPTFPQAELDRAITQSKSGLEVSRNDANFIAGNIATATRNDGHPYGEVQYPEHLDNITTGLLRQYYETYFKPNIAYLIIVGDIDKSEAEKLANKYFGKWKKGNVRAAKYPKPSVPEANRVAFGNRIGAMQSVVQITYPLDFTPGNPDAIKASAMNTILGGGAFFGRLMQNIREDKGWTYGSYSSLWPGEEIGGFSAQAEVRNSVTDSTVTEILYEMRRMMDEPVDEGTLQMVKNYMSGNFGRALERPETIANYAYNIKRYNLPEDYYATYLQKLNAVTAEDIQEMARKYLKPENAIIVVAGNQDEVVDNLKQFAANGEVEIYDPFGRPVAPPKEVSEDITASGVIENYINAIGGLDKLNGVMDLWMKGSLEVQGMSLELEQKQKAPDKYYSVIKMMGNVFQEQVFDGKKGYNSGMGQKQNMTEDEVKDMEFQSKIFPELFYDALGYKFELAGSEKINDQDAYHIKITNPSGKTSSDYFSMETGLKIRSLITQDSPMGSVTIISDFSDYREVNEVLFPFMIKQQAGPQSFEIVFSEIKINSGLSDDDFKVE